MGRLANQTSRLAKAYGLRLEEPDLEQMKAIAASEQIYLSQVTRRAVKLYLASRPFQTVEIAETLEAA